MASDLLRGLSGGKVVPFPQRPKLTSFDMKWSDFKLHYYIMYEEDLSNFLSETDTVITKN